ncbi:uncharacterized protein LOC141658955 [Silene latifolia]|uniref:uncharacterized protein LOC141658955 n=1 Tax=Silene latifolia TaxID=37657 RepID=UPI003D7758D3
MAAAPMKSPLHDFPLTFLKWNTKKDRRCPPSPPPSSPTPPPPTYPVGSRSSRNRRPATPAEPERKPEPEPEPEPEDVEKHWNLRPRRRPSSSFAAAAASTMAADAAENSLRSTRLSVGEGSSGGGNGEKRKFWIALSKDEIEEDIYSITGCKPSRRPRKRPKIVQKHLDNVFPGLWLVGLTPDSYRNFDPPPLK